MATKAKSGMNKNYWTLVVVALALFVAGYMWWFYRNHHEVDLPPQYTPKPNALKNRYYAATKLLGENRSQTLAGNEGYKKLAEILLQDDAQAKQNTLIIYQIASGNPQDFETLIGWVQRGGHLVVASQATMDKDARQDGTKMTEYQGEQNPLLLYLDIDYLQNTEYSGGSIVSGMVPLHLENGETFVLRPQAGGYFYLDKFLQKYPNARPYDYEWFVKDTTGAYWLKPNNQSGLTKEQYDNMLLELNPKDGKSPQINVFSANRAFVDMAFGKGRLTVLADGDMFANPSPDGVNAQTKDHKTEPPASRTQALLTDYSASGTVYGYSRNIAEADNAYFLQYLTADRTVYFLPQIESDGFFSLLKKHLPYTLWGLFFTVLVLLFALPKRFGAIKHYQTDSARNIFGFFAHVGQYLWQSDKATGLLTSNRHALIHSIMAKELLHDNSPQSITEAVAKKTGLSFGLIEDALYQTWQTDDEFLRISRSFAQVAKFYQD